MSGKFNFTDLLKDAKKIKDFMEKTQADLAKIWVTGESGAGLIKITMNAQHEVQDLDISEEALKECKEVLEDLIKAAINDAHRKIIKIAQEKMMAK